MSSGPLIREHGRVLNVSDEQRGSQLSQDELAGARTIHLNDVADFNDLGGQLTLNGVVYTYDALNDTAETLHLTAGLATNVLQDAAVTITPAVYDRWALVRVDDAYDTSEGTYAFVPFGLYASLPPGQRDQEGEEWVTCVKDNNRWIVQDVRSDNSGQPGGIGASTRKGVFVWNSHPDEVYDGALAVPILPTFDGIFNNARATCGRSPTGGAATFDVKLNGASILPALISIAAGGTLAADVTPTTVAFARNDELQIVCGTANNVLDVILQIDYTRSS